MPITTTRGVALYVGALLGPGLLVLPGLAAAEAGPASILAWAGLLVLSGLVAVVFAALGVRHRAGGVAGYTRLGLGQRAGRAAGWCFQAGIVAGAPAVCYLGSGYLATLLGGGTRLTAIIAMTLLLGTLAITTRGVHASSGVQLVLVAVLLVVILLAITGAAPSVSAGNWTPFAPHGWPAIGSAAVVLMVSFVGWEAIAPLTGRLADPARQLPRVIGVAFAVTAVLYLVLVAVTIGVGAGSSQPFTVLLTYALGAGGPVVAAVAAIVLTVGTVNSYLSGALHGAARRLPAAIVVSSAVLLTLAGTGHLAVTSVVSVASSFFLVVYLGCMLAAVRVLRGGPRLAAAIAAVGVVVVLAFGGWAALPAVLLALACLAPAARSAPVPRLHLRLRLRDSSR